MKKKTYVRVDIDVEIGLNDKTLEQVAKARYLEVKVSHGGSKDSVCKDKNKNVSGIYLPTVSYGCELWALTVK